MGTPLNLLEVRGLTVTYLTQTAPLPTLDKVDLDVATGECVGLFGESGAGKTTLALALLRLLPRTATVSGSVHLDGVDVTNTTWGRLRALRWKAASIVFQGATQALNPVQRVGGQIEEPILLHERSSGTIARSRAAALLRQVGLPPAAAGAYPHELSGGERQRALIAMALACDPRLVVADEPTTALDTVRQAQILDLITGLVTGHGRAMLLISHDLRLLSSTCDRIAVMHAGRIVEEGTPAEVCAGGRHPQTRALLTAHTRIRALRHRHRPRPPSPAGHVGVPVLAADDLVVIHPARRGRNVRAVDGVRLDLAAGEIVAVVGESGCGKTTLARALVGMHPPTGGEIRVDGVPLRPTGPWLRAHRRRVQLVLQDPGSALDPRHTVYDAVAEGLRIHRLRPPGGEPAAVAAALVRAGLQAPETFFGRYPQELSGGLRQRVVIAGALILQPRVLIADEPVSSLDAAARADVLTLLLDLRDRSGLAALVISHDLELAWSIADRVAVMYLGRIIEVGPAQQVLGSPAHPYTAALLAAMPQPFTPLAATLDGEPPRTSSLPGGCRFHPRCPVLLTGTADAAGIGHACRTVEPEPLPAVGPAVACHYAAAEHRS